MARNKLLPMASLLPFLEGLVNDCFPLDVLTAEVNANTDDNDKEKDKKKQDTPVGLEKARLDREKRELVVREQRRCSFCSPLSPSLISFFHAYFQ